MRITKPLRSCLVLETLEHRCLLAAQPVLTELMASNQQTLRDGDGDSPDWVEVANLGDAPIDLLGWHLTDDPRALAKWTFPSTPLAAGQFLVVFASDKDTTDAAGHLHTNFKLSSNGEYLALVQPDGQTIASEFRPGYPQQLTDVSYGRAMQGGQLLGTQGGYFDRPSPGEANAADFSLGPIIRTVDHQPAVPALADPLVVTASVVATQHPTGSVSLVYRVMYDGEVTVAMVDDGSGADTRAGDGIYTGVVPAGTAAAGQMLRYSVVAQDVQGASSRSPRPLDTEGTDRSAEYYGTVVADLAVASALPIFQWFTSDTAGARSRRGARASVFFAGEFYDNIFVRQRGGFTNTASQKFDFNEEDQPFFVNERLGRVSEINLNAQGSDPSFLRQTLAYESYTEAGNQSSHSFLVRMQRNGSFDRVGVFIEQVDQDFLRRQGLDPEGALYKFVQRDNLNPGLDDTRTGVEKKTRLDEDLSDLQLLIDGLHLPTAEARRRHVVDHFNVPQLMNYLAVRAVTRESDDVRKNFYLYRDTNGTGEWYIFPWDKDWTFGVSPAASSYLGHPFFGDESHGYENPDQWNVLYTIVFGDPELRALYVRRLRSVMDQLLQPSDAPAGPGWMENRLEFLAAAAEPDLSRGAVAAIDAVRDYFPQRRQDLYQTHSIDNLGGQGPITTLVPELATDIRYFVPSDNSLGDTWHGLAEPANAAEWNNGTLGIGFEATPRNFQELINTRVAPQESCDTCTSIFVRVPFTVVDASAIHDLTLRVKYDDGFIAYLNGVEVARSNVTGDPTFDVRARTRANGDAVQFEDFLLAAPHVALLQNGQNVLAFQAVNSTPTSSDMLLSPTLLSGRLPREDVAGIPHAQATDIAIGFGAYEARPTSGNRGEQYIELRNPHDVAVDVTGWRLAGDVVHTFAPGTVIPAGGSLYATPSARAFRQRALSPTGGEGHLVQQINSGQLAEDGPHLQLFNPLGQLVATLPSGPVAGDLTQDGRLDQQDLDRLCAAILANEQAFDLTGDQVLDFQDLDYLVTDLMQTDFGDANLDGRFDSRDLVQIFQAGQYEDGIPGNSSWSEGDWNCDGEFASDDLVLALQRGGYRAF